MHIATYMVFMLFIPCVVDNQSTTFNKQSAQFDVPGSVHLGNVYIQLKVKLDVLFLFFIPLYLLAAIAPILRSSNCSLQP
jgi:hypothetical protein